MPATWKDPWRCEKCGRDFYLTHPHGESPKHMDCGILVPHDRRKDRSAERKAGIGMIAWYLAYADLHDCDTPSDEEIEAETRRRYPDE